MEMVACSWCADAPVLAEQFYETKLFRVVIARHALVQGHVAIVPKRHIAHFYAFSLDELEEFGYLVKKVSFWVMRWRRASGFYSGFSDGTPEVINEHHLMISVIPYVEGEQGMMTAMQAITPLMHTVDEAIVSSMVKELQDLMQLPQQ